MGLHKLNPNVLETDRLYLRELTPEVYQHLFTKCSDAEICEYLGIKADKELAEKKAKFSKGIVTCVNEDSLLVSLLLPEYELT